MQSYIKPHWSFWLICIVALIWNLMGSMNFIMQANPEMLANYPDAVRSLVEARPWWATTAFAVAVYGGVLAEIFLLLKKAHAYYLFMASFLGAFITNIHTFQVTSVIDVWIGSLMSLIIAGFLIWYSRLVKSKGWIK
jgi:hypothetical protein